MLRFGATSDGGLTGGWRSWGFYKLLMYDRFFAASESTRPPLQVVDATARALLESIVKLAEAQLNQARGVLLALDGDGRIWHEAAPNLPKTYTSALDGRPLAEAPQAFGEAVNRRRPVVVPDLLASDGCHPRERELALSHGLRACWSIPILVADTVVSGLLVLYSPDPCEPTPEEWQLIEYWIDLACFCWQHGADRQMQVWQAACIEAASDGVAILDGDRYCYLNSAHCLLFGYDRPEELVGKTWRELYEPAESERIEREVFPHLVRQGSWYGQITGKRRDGSQFPQEVSLTLTTDGKLICVCRNVSARKAAETALQQSQQILRQVIDNIPQVIAWKDCSLAYLGCNRQAAALAGTTPQEVVGKRDCDLLWTEEQAAWLQHCDRRVIEAGEPEFHTIENHHLDGGKQVWFNTSRLPLRDDVGKIVGLLVASEDVTERLAAERRIQSFSASLHHLHRLSTRNFKDYPELFRAYLHAGCEMLDMPTGVVARLVGDDTLALEFVRSGAAGQLTSGACVPLENTLCELAIRQRSTVAVASRRDRHLARDSSSAAPELQADCCLATPIWVDREIYGILSFMAPHDRSTPFEAHECEIVEVMARDLGRFVAAQRSEHQRVEAETALRHSETKYRSIFENISQGIFQTTPSGRFLSVNPFLAQLLGYASPQALVAAVTDIATLYASPERRGQLARETERLGAVRGVESQIYRRDGTAIWISENQRAVAGSTGKLLYYEGTVEDITARRLAEERLQHDAFHDKLTGLHNRAWFTQQLQTEIARSEDSPQRYGVLFVDLDRFKVINDSLGHLVGDDLLVQVAQRLRGIARPDDTLARFGGDEFAILLRQIREAPDAIAVAEALIALLQEPIRLGSQELSIGASIGIALGSSEYRRVEEVLRDADLAMYRAKADGGSGYALFEEAMLPQAMTRLQLEHDLQRAIELEELHLYYQPIYALCSGRLCGFEALLRWRHNQKGWIGPTDFIPVAEETGTIHSVGWWALETSFRQLQHWRQVFAAVADAAILHVNVSGTQLKQRDFADRIGQLLRTYELPSSAVEIEITETSFFETASLDARILEGLRCLGCKLCIDDFGTGYSSLSRLHALQVDTIKIDRAFVDGIDVDPTKAAIAQTILALARNLGAKVVSEGIETAAQQQKLQDLGCEFGQGFLHSRPLEAKAIDKLLAKLLAAEKCS